MPALIDVIVPVHNGSKWLDQALQSISPQRFGLLRPIVIDDGSHDNSAKIASSLLEGTSGRVIQVEHAGLGAARNTGILSSDSDYILFLDSDDLIRAPMLQRLAKVALRLELDLLAFDTKPFSARGEFKRAHLRERRSYYRRRTSASRQIESGFDLFGRFWEQKSYLPSACLYLIRKKFLDEIELKFIEGIIHEDLWFSANAFRRATRAMYFKKAIHKRRLHRDSITHSLSLEEQIASLGITLEAFNQSQLFDVYENHTSPFSQLIMAYENRLERLKAESERQSR